MNHREFSRLLSERGNEVKGIHLGLQRMQAVMQRLGNPHLSAPVIHIAGTNGKGSAAAMAESILRHGGRKTGLYTSPHLVRLEERIRINGRNILPARLGAWGGRVIETENALLAAGTIDHPLTYFELVTSCAFLHFEDQRVDAAVVEVGLGGRLDATNIVAPRVCAITGIAYDHQDLLGNSLAKIAAEKAGIIKPGVPVVFAAGAPVARRVIRRAAHLRGAPAYEFGRDIRVHAACGRFGRFTMELETPRGVYKRLALSLAGEHQVRNAALAVAALEQLKDPALTEKAVRSGLAATSWPGRLEEFRARRRTLLDGAHNAEGAALLSEFLRLTAPEEIHLVFAALSDKNVRAMAGLLFPLARTVHLANIENPRAAGPDTIEAASPRGARIYSHPNSSRALRAAWDACSRHGLVVVAGSLYLVGELLPLVRKEAKRRANSGNEIIKGARLRGA